MKKSYPIFILSYCIFLIAVGITSCSEKSDEETQPPLKSDSYSPAPLVESTLEPVMVTEKTRETYQWYCAQCHGIQGKGDGINAKFLTVPPRNHTKAKYLETRTDEQFFEAIKFGGLSVGRAP
ncbi:MAG: hypothetical protein ACI9UO_003120, partial [Nitrospinales bacterium]